MGEDGGGDADHVVGVGDPGRQAGTGHAAEERRRAARDPRPDDGRHPAHRAGGEPGLRTPGATAQAEVERPEPERRGDDGQHWERGETRAADAHEVGAEHDGDERHEAERDVAGEREDQQRGGERGEAGTTDGGEPEGEADQVGPPPGIEGERAGADGGRGREPESGQEQFGRRPLEEAGTTAEGGVLVVRSAAGDLVGVLRPAVQLQAERDVLDALAKAVGAGRGRRRLRGAEPRQEAQRRGNRLRGCGRSMEEPAEATRRPGRRRRVERRRGDRLLRARVERAGAREQGVVQLAGRRTAAGLRVERRVDQALDAGRHVRAALRQPDPAIVQRDQVLRGLRPVRVLADERLVEHQRRRPDVDLVVGRLAEHLLRRHVAQRSQEAVVDRRVGGLEVGDPEVRQLRHAILAQEDVAGLDVPVDDPLRVGVGERVADGRDGAQDVGVGQLAGAEGRDEVAALHVLEHDVRVVLVLDHVEQPHDRGVVQLPPDPQLAAGAAGQGLVLGDRLEGDDAAAGVEVRRLEDGRRPAHAGDPADREPVGDDPLREEGREARLGVSGPRHQPLESPL